MKLKIVMAALIAAPLMLTGCAGTRSVGAAPLVVERVVDRVAGRACADGPTIGH